MWKSLLGYSDPVHSNHRRLLVGMSVLPFEPLRPSSFEMTIQVDHIFKVVNVILLRFNHYAYSLPDAYFLNMHGVWG